VSQRRLDTSKRPTNPTQHDDDVSYYGWHTIISPYAGILSKNGVSLSEEVKSHIFARGVCFTLQENIHVKGAKACSTPPYLRDGHNAGCTVPVFTYEHARRTNMCRAAPAALRHIADMLSLGINMRVRLVIVQKLACVGDIVLKLSRFQRIKTTRLHLVAIGIPVALLCAPANVPTGPRPNVQRPTGHHPPYWGGALYNYFPLGVPRACQGFYHKSTHTIL
jgi:hypothetical protein